MWNNYAFKREMKAVGFMIYSQINWFNNVILLATHKSIAFLNRTSVLLTR